MRILSTIVVVFLLVTSSTIHAQCFTCDNAPLGTFFCDDFESTSPLTERYFEVNNDEGDLLVMNNIGRDGGRALRILFQQGEVGAGGLSKSFGKIPSNYIAQNASRRDTSFTEIYWRMDVRHQPGWQGNGPAKLSRALVFANANWAQGMMAHLWSGGTDDKYLIMDPASGIDTNGMLRSTKYNDFANLRWLGYRLGTTPMFADENAGTWYCVVGHVKLNTPGSLDGVFEFWINDTLQQSATNLNWHDTWNNDTSNMTINAVFFESYWNAGSPVQQERYFDNLLISTQPIPCECNTQTSVGEYFAPEHIVSTQYFDMLGREVQYDALSHNVVVFQVRTSNTGRRTTRLLVR